MSTPLDRLGVRSYPRFSLQKYTRRRFTTPDGSKSFQVFALESMKGHEVLIKLAKGDYKNNPVKSEH